MSATLEQPPAPATANPLRLPWRVGDVYQDDIRDCNGQLIISVATTGEINHPTDVAIASAVVAAVNAHGAAFAASHKEFGSMSDRQLAAALWHEAEVSRSPRMTALATTIAHRLKPETARRLADAACNACGAGITTLPNGSAYCAKCLGAWRKEQAARDEQIVRGVPDGVAAET